MLEFRRILNAAPVPGLVLRVGNADARYLRLTHLFDDCVYFMWVGEPENARYARRPGRKLLRELLQLAEEPGAEWGHLTLPPALAVPPQAGTEEAQDLDSAWNLIEPLINSFKRESNLSRSRFTSLIRERAEATQTRFITLHRMVLRYYYFGGTRLALLTLPRGIQPGRAAYSGNRSKDAGKLQRQSKRRGRQTLLAKELGANDFTIHDDDVADMVDCLRSCLRKGPTFLTNAHEEYLAKHFRRRHPTIHTDYLAGKHVEPVTLRQYRYYIAANARLSDDLARNLRTKERHTGYLGSLRAAGPGEVYEIDSTGGRFYLVSDDDPPLPVGKPTIYLIIDRWSRFVVSAYISLRAPSYEEVRHVLLVAFTSRETRFRALGIDIDDERWPIGRMPAELCPDRGSDFMSRSMEQSVVQDLRIDLTPLPPFCPDGKAIVERMIREIKRRMASSGMKGTFADRPLDPHSKRLARTAERVAVYSLADAYRALIEIVVDHNNRPHSALRRRRILTQAGIPPTPQSAYVWGLENITGLRSAPLSEDDYRRLLLSVDNASIANGILRYKTRAYLPANEAAFEMAAKSPARAKQIVIRLDKTAPHRIEVPSSRGEWAQFRITAGGADELAGLSLDEEDALASRTAALWARADHEARVGRVAAKSVVKRTLKRREPTTKLDKRQLLNKRNQETTHLKRRLTGQITQRATKAKHTQPPPPSADWSQIEEQERLRKLQLIRKHRSKR